MSKKFRFLMALVLITGLLGGLLTSSTVSADPSTGDVIEIPRIDMGDVFGTGDWDTKIQIQNVGAEDTTVTVTFWGEYSYDCPPNEPGDLDEDAVMWIPAGGVWTLHNAIPDDAESAFITHSNEADAELAVTVDRWGPDPFGAVALSSSYTGIADPDMVGPLPLTPPYEYYAPYIMHGYNNLDTTITIQNSGDICASIWIYYKEEANCEFQKAFHVEQIAPGESIRIGPGADADEGYPSPELNAPWLGSAYVTANVPLAIVVDQLSITAGPGDNAGTLLSMRGMPFDQSRGEIAGERKWYADLLYREISGYTSAIQVQNLTQTSLPTFVTVQFFDQSGDEILFVGDWICRNAAATFYLPAIVDLGVNFPFGYVGAAEIESHGQVDYPGDAHAGEPIFAVVDIKKTKVWDGAAWRHTVAGETQGGAYNAHPEHQKENAWGWAMPFIAKEQEGVTSRIAIRNNSNCTKIDGNILIKDETGRTVAYIPVGWLHPKHMTVKDLNYFGQIAPGFVGAAVYEVTNVEQLCDTDWDGETDIEPVMPSAVVLNYGYAAELDPFNPALALPQTTEGDLTRVYEAIPFNYDFSPCVLTVSGNVIDNDTLEPIDLADVQIGGVTQDATDSTGYYEFTLAKTADPMESFVLTAAKTGYASSDPTSVTITGCDDVVANFELDRDCNVTISGYVEDKETGLWINGAVVRVTNGNGAYTTTTSGNGAYTIAVPFDADGANIVDVTATGYNPAVDSVYIPECFGTAQISFQLHDDPMSRILLYYGNGGEAPDTTPDQTTLAPTGWITAHNYYNADALFKYFGYQSDYTNVWPTDPDLEEYKVIFLLGPGNTTTDPASDNFTTGQIAQLDLFLRNGGRLVVMADSTGAVTVENNLLDALDDIGLNFVAGSIADALVNVITDDQVTTDVATLDFDTAITVTEGAAVPGWLGDLPDATTTILAADDLAGVTRPTATNWDGTFAGDVVAIGDMDWMDDFSFMGTVTYDPVTGNVDYVWPNWAADNENLLLNLFSFTE